VHFAIGDVDEGRDVAVQIKRIPPGKTILSVGF
jgi:hypothetical protein